MTKKRGDKMTKTKKAAQISLIAWIAAILYTLLVKFVDVRPIGPEGSEVGFALINGLWRDLVGVHPVWDKISDGCLALEFLIVAAFGFVALIQLIKGRSWYAIDDRVKVQDFFYLLVGLTYVFFEFVIINYRPVLSDDGVLKASYPSSHTVAVLTIAFSGLMTTRRIFHHSDQPTWMWVVPLTLAVIATVGRLISGMHWLSDVFGAILISAALLMFYRIALVYQEER